MRFNLYYSERIGHPVPADTPKASRTTEYMVLHNATQPEIDAYKKRFEWSRSSWRQAQVDECFDCAKPTESPVAHNGTKFCPPCFNERQAHYEGRGPNKPIVFRITVNVVEPDGSLGKLVDIVEMESSDFATPEEATSFKLWENYEA